VLDWYNFIVQHNPTPTEERGGYKAENGKGNAYINPLRDISRGRIWRVVPKSAEVHETDSLDSEDPAGLLHALSGDNMLWRLHAQRLLVERGETDVLNDLFNMVNDPVLDQMGMAPGALHALWTLHGLGVIGNNDAQADAVVKGALFHPAASVRKAAIQILPRTAWADEGLIQAGVLHDRDPGVQLQAILYFAERESSEEIGRLLYGLSKDKNIRNDKWLAEAVYTAATRHITGFVEAFQQENRGYTIPTLLMAGSDGLPLEGDALAETFVKTYINKAGQSAQADGEMAKAGTSLTIRTIKNEMKYDITEFVVEAGETVELVFENTDFMQHNLVITQPGKKELVGMAADKLATDPNGAAQNYIPKMPEVLFATAILNPEEKVTLRFTAPSEPGIYPYICTFPGHWRIMQGTMRVVAAI
jgi:azurin